MRAIFNYFKESWTELGKVQWPNRQTTMRITIAVLGISVFIGLYISAVDIGLNELVKRVILK